VDLLSGFESARRWNKKVHDSFEDEQATKETDEHEDSGLQVRYYGMRWDSEKFNDMVVDPCWQQHERGRPVSDWMVAY
jgi:hypothetical protein